MFDPTKEERTWDDIRESSGIDDKDTIQFLASKSYAFFFEHVLGYETTSPVTQKAIEFQDNPEKFKETSDDKDAIKKAVMAPRGHSKTVSWTIGPSLWRAYKEHGKEIIISSASRSQSTDILADIKRIIVRNDALKHLNPDSPEAASMGESSDIESGEETWAAKSVTTTTDVTIQTKTFGSGIRSKHVDYVFLDDVLQDEGQGSRGAEQEKDTFYNVVTPIIENKGGLLQIVGTPMSHDDLLMELMDKDNFSTTKYKAYNPDTDDVLWPEKWSIDGLKQKKAEIGPARFAREYMCNPMSVEEQYFAEEHCIKPNLTMEHFKPNPAEEEYNSWEFALGVDVALSDKKGSDFNVFTVIGSPRDGDNRYVVDLIKEQTMSPEAIADEIARLDGVYGLKEGYYEKNAQGEGLRHEMKDRERLRHIDAFDTTGKSRPQVLSGLQAALYRQELKLADVHGAVDELAAFHKNSRGKLEGKGHDDTVMSLAIAYHCFDPGEIGQTGIGFIGMDDYDEGGGPDGIVDYTGDPGSNDSDEDMAIGIA